MYILDSLYDLPLYFIFFFFNDTATTEIYTLSLHDALPISLKSYRCAISRAAWDRALSTSWWSSLLTMSNDESAMSLGDRKSTRLNSSHSSISYAVFCLKKKKKTNSII